MNPYASGAHWRDSARITRFFIFDARAAFPFLFLLLHIRLWTFIAAIITTSFFSALERYGFSVPVFRRWIRSAIAGRRRIARPWWKYSQFK